jgi:mRNA-degrading endonuclease RelE of RelBE toxin-antitoxin system
VTIVQTRRFQEEFAALPPTIKERARKQLALLLTSPKHHSLFLKKLKGYENMWEGRITQQYRFTFSVTGDTYTLRRIGPHDIERHP